MQKGDFIQVAQILDNGKIFPNLINLNTVERIVFIQEDNIAEIHFHAQPNLSKKEIQFENFIEIKVSDMEKFLKKVEHLIIK